MNAGGVDKACKLNGQMSDFGLQISDGILEQMDVTELRIYQGALELLPQVYVLAKQFPKSEFKHRSQLCNSAKAISAQIAEGFAKKDSQVEFKRFLLMALGSSDETITHLRQIKILKFKGVDLELCVFLIEKYQAESKQINSLVQKIKDNSTIRI
jgi:four helix bundle protein